MTQTQRSRRVWSCPAHEHRKRHCSDCGRSGRKYVANRDSHSYAAPRGMRTEKRQQRKCQRLSDRVAVRRGREPAQHVNRPWLD